jgi:hypothetical protein
MSSVCNCWCLEIITKYFIHIQDNVFIGNIPFAHCRFDSKIICFYTFYASYFPYGGQNGTLSRQTREEQWK